MEKLERQLSDERNQFSIFFITKFYPGNQTTFLLDGPLFARPNDNPLTYRLHVIFDNVNYITSQIYLK